MIQISGIYKGGCGCEIDVIAVPYIQPQAHVHIQICIYLKLLTRDAYMIKIWSIYIYIYNSDRQKIYHTWKHKFMHASTCVYGWSLHRDLHTYIHAYIHICICLGVCYIHDTKISHACMHTDTCILYTHAYTAIHQKWVYYGRFKGLNVQLTTSSLPDVQWYFGEIPEKEWL